MGSDVYSRILFGARITIAIAVIAIGVSVLIGVPVGLIAGYYNNWVSDALMRTSDIFLAVPQIVLAIAIAQTLGTQHRERDPRALRHLLALLGAAGLCRDPIRAERDLCRSLHRAWRLALAA